MSLSHLSWRMKGVVVVLFFCVMYLSWFVNISVKEYRYALTDVSVIVESVNEDIIPSVKLIAECSHSFVVVHSKNTRQFLSIGNLSGSSVNVIVLVENSFHRYVAFESFRNVNSLSYQLPDGMHVGSYNVVIQVEPLNLLSKREPWCIISNPIEVLVVHSPAHVQNKKQNDSSMCSWDNMNEWQNSGHWVNEYCSDIKVPRWEYEFDTCGYKESAQQHVDTFLSSDELVSSGAPVLWLVVLGSSVERGLFLYMARLLFGKEFVLEEYSKCWGFVDIRYRNIRLTFNDFRNVAMPAEHNLFQCENAVVASDGKIQERGLLFWKYLFADPHLLPDLILFGYVALSFDSLRNNINLYSFLNVTKSVPKWTGKVLIVFLSSNAPIDKVFWSDLRNVTRREQERHAVTLTLQEKFPFVNVLNSQAMVASMLDDIEMYVDFAYSSSPHLHYSCKDSSGALQVCGAVVKSVSYLVLSLLFTSRPSHNTHSHLRHSSSSAKEDLSICSICRKRLIPFDIEVPNNTSCVHKSDKYSVALTEERRCPASCLSQPVLRTFISAGGSNVSVRQCEHVQ